MEKTYEPNNEITDDHLTISRNMEENFWLQKYELYVRVDKRIDCYTFEVDESGKVEVNIPTLPEDTNFNLKVSLRKKKQIFIACLN